MMRIQKNIKAHSSTLESRIGEESILLDGQIVNNVPSFGRRMPNDLSRLNESATGAYRIMDLDLDRPLRLSMD